MSISPNQSNLDATEYDSEGRLRSDRARVSVDRAAAASSEKIFFKRDTETRRSVLIEIIEGEIIPRLFMAHCELSHRALDRRSCDVAVEESDCESLANLFIGGDSSAIINYVETLMARGIRREQIYLDFLAPVPRTLSILWSEGRCSFDAMVSGLSCVDQVLQEIHDREIKGAKI